MHRPGPTTVLSVIGRLAGAVAVLAGLPIALTVAFGWPLPTAIPSWETLTSTPLRFVDPTVILNAFVCLVWVCWAVLFLYTAVGVADALRGRPTRVHLITPLGTLAGKITASVLLFGSLARPVTVAALPPAAAISVSVDNVGQVDTTPPASPGIPTPVFTPPADRTYVVQRGDTLWDIAAVQLGDPFRWPEIRDLNADLFGNPSLIRSGWELTLPADVQQPAEPTAPTTPASSSQDPEPSAPASPEPPSPGELPQLLRPSNSVTEPTDATTNAEQVDAPAAIPVIGLAGLTVLATGLAAALQRRRRRSTATPLPFYDPSPIERSLVAASDLPLVRWLGQELSALGETLTGRAHRPVPLAVEFSEATGVEILWDQPAEDAPDGWSAEPGGWAWRRAYDPSQPVPEADRPAAIPGLVTVGRRDDKQLLVNLEALGAVALVGAPGAAEDLLRSMLVELATGDEVAQAQVLLTDPIPSGVELLGAHALPVSDAIARLRGVRAEADQLLDRIGCSTTFAYRTFSAPVLPLDLTVVAGAATSDDLMDDARSAPAHRAAVTLLLGDADLENRIELTADGTATLQPLGIRFTPAALPASTVNEIVELPETAHDPQDAPPDGVSDLRPWWLDTDSEESTPSDTIDLRVEAEVSGAEAVLEPDPVPPSILVKVLGAPRLEGGVPLGRRELTVLALVACSSRPVTHEQVQDAIWGSTPISSKTVFNLIGSARSALGSRDGGPLLGAASRPDNTISLDPAVGTDLELFRNLLAAARRSPSGHATQLLVQALELVEGPPFGAAGYDWAVTEQLVSEAEHLIEAAAVMCAELALDAGDLERARWALQQGLRAVPGDELLYRLRMKVEDSAGNPAGVRRAFQELETHLDEYGLSPSQVTVELLADLTAAQPPHSQHATGA